MAQCSTNAWGEALTATGTLKTLFVTAIFGDKLEAISSMYKTLSLEYSDLLLHDRPVLEYLSGHADIFTGIGRQYDRLDRMLQTFEPYLLQKEMNVKKWETTTTEKDGVTLYRYFLCDACEK